MQAFHGSQEIKDKYLTRVREHAAMDQIIQGYGYWRGGKGCAVGCTLHHFDGLHGQYEVELGIPRELAFMEDYAFERMGAAASKTWPERFLSSIIVGSDLSSVYLKLVEWVLLDSGWCDEGVLAASVLAARDEDVRKAIADTIAGTIWDADKVASHFKGHGTGEWLLRSTIKGGDTHSDPWVSLVEGFCDCDGDDDPEGCLSDTWEKIADKILELVGELCPHRNASKEVTS